MSDGWELTVWLREYQIAHGRFHTAWSAAVGTPGYRKALWIEMSNALDRLARDRATSLGHPPGAPLL